jgi:hypothetical protein
LGFKPLGIQTTTVLPPTLTQNSLYRIKLDSSSFSPLNDFSRAI